ncbi:hypothetical protein TNCV_2600881 [Trichonephila clavipes]|nr:hypothetical protein TNCV_2600881 [Trichonephila clavipes]
MVKSTIARSKIYEWHWCHRTESVAWCLNEFEKIIVKHLHKSLKIYEDIHTTRRRRLRASLYRKRPRFWQSDDLYLCMTTHQHIDSNW